MKRTTTEESGPSELAPIARCFETRLRSTNRRRPKLERTLHIYIYIYIYRERERDREIDRERERDLTKTRRQPNIHLMCI